MKFGVFDHIDANGMPLGEQYEQRLRFVARYESLGFHAYHLAEHHATQLGMASSSSIFLSAVAQRTRTLKFGPLVYLLPLHHPVRLLEEIGMLDQLSGGRFQLGVGPGGQSAEHTRFGVAREDVRPMFDEALEILLKGLGQEVLPQHKGRFYDLPPVPQLIRPVQEPFPPLWYGTSSPERAIWAAVHGVNLVTMLPHARARTIVEALDEAWSAAGKPADERPFVGLLRNVVVADSDAEAQRIAARVWRAFAVNFNWLVNWLGLEPFPIPADFAGAEEMGLAFAGSPESAIEWIERAEAEAGVNYLAAELVFGDMTTEEAERSITLFGEEVIPAFA
jgi:alkanesulfonate monooxygenase SsuD/methylene tetrahydromethanopterin reductase-like flavin-dependent oxidoreductase (luciferase family)